MDENLNLVLDNIGRRFNREWIFRNINYTFQTGQTYAILGPNGSGKSTLLQVISGSLTPSEGTLFYQSGIALAMERVYEKVSLVAPYMELIEDYTLQEQVDFHFKFKRYRDGFNAEKLIELAGLQKSRNKAIKHFSSGMKQRVKLALAFCADTPVLLLDEPASNLDVAGIAWYHELVNRFSDGSLLIVCSNQEHEYLFCRNTLTITDYKY